MFEIEGDLSEADQAELVALAQARSPVFDIVAHGVPVACSLGPARRSPKRRLPPDRPWIGEPADCARRLGESAGAAVARDVHGTAASILPEHQISMS